MYTTVTVGVLVFMCFVAMLVVFDAGARVSASRDSQSFLAYAAAAAVAALGSSVLYVVWAESDATPALVGGDVAMCMTPGLVWLAVRRLNGSAASAVALLVVVGIGVGCSAAFLPVDVSSAIKFVVLIAFCAAGAIDYRRGPAAKLRGSLTVSITLIAYGAFSLGRLLALLLSGFESPLYEQLFSSGPTTLVGTVAVAGMTIGVGSMLRMLSGATRVARSTQRVAFSDGIRARRIAGEDVQVADLRIDDWELVAASGGRARRAALHAALVKTAADAFGADDVIPVAAGRVLAVSDGASTAARVAAARSAFAEAVAGIGAVGVMMHSAVGDETLFEATA